MIFLSLYSLPMLFGQQPACKTDAHSGELVAGLPSNK